MRHLLCRMALLALSLAISGCAVSIPLPSLLEADSDTTGSIEKPQPRQSDASQSRKAG